MSNCQFENIYVELEQHLRRITNLPEWSGVVALYEKTLPSYRAADIETLRKYRNNVVGHGRRVGGSAPIVPQAWIDCLKAEIDYIKQNETEVANEVIAVFKKLNNVSFASALERIFNNRKADGEMMDSFLVYSKLGDICGSGIRSKKTILAYYEIDKRLHLFQSIMQDDKDLRSCYSDVSDVVGEKEFFDIIEVVENLVSREKEENNFKATTDTALSPKGIEDKNNSKQEGAFNRDSTYWECLRFAVIEKTVSISFFQRRLYIGYIRAGEIIGQMAQDGFIKKKTGSHTWDVLLTESEYKKRYGELH